MTEIICNQAYCKICKELVISHHRHDFNSCKGGHFYVDGGRDYLKRTVSDSSVYEDRSISSSASFEVIRENLYRGTHGKDGKQPLKWVRLSEIEDEWLVNLIPFAKEHGQRDLKYYLLEAEYRGIVL